jgi:hypothetical protein
MEISKTVDSYIVINWNGVSGTYQCRIRGSEVNRLLNYVKILVEKVINDEDNLPCI